MIKQYPKHNGSEEDRGFTADEIKRGIHILYQDYECPDCGKVQAVSMGRICLSCGRKHD